jgi:hypothetical protein
MKKNIAQKLSMGSDFSEGFYFGEKKIHLSVNGAIQ